MSQPHKPYVYAIAVEDASPETPLRRARKLKVKARRLQVQLATYKENQAFEEEVVALLTAAQKELEDARIALAECEATVPRFPESVVLKKQQVAEAKARLAAVERQLAMLHGGAVNDEARVAASTSMSPKSDQAVQVALTPKPVQRRRSQEDAVLLKLSEFGYDPKALPAVQAGKKSHAKHRVREALGFSDAVMNKAWQRLRDDDRIKDA
jgi:hypothetical protein